MNIFSFTGNTEACFGITTTFSHILCLYQSDWSLRAVTAVHLSLGYGKLNNSSGVI